MRHLENGNRVLPRDIREAVEELFLGGGPSRSSKWFWTGTRVLANTGAPLMRSGSAAISGLGSSMFELL